MIGSAGFRLVGTSSGGRAVRIAFVLALVAGLVPLPASAKSHLWKFTEVFSNADGSVQFVEMFVFDPAGTAEWQFRGFTLESAGQVFTFPSNLPRENTFERWVLLATPAFAALPGAPTPDYVIPAGFIDPEGDELRYRTMLDILPLPAGALPIDGVHSMARDGAIAVNSPINFAGVAGSIDVAPCRNGADDDGDGATDVAEDPGCASELDPDGSERDASGALACDDGEDDDGDGLADHPDDPACHDPAWPQERAKCQDGVDNDAQLGTDFDGGVSILGPAGADPNGADPDCAGRPWRDRERAGCGLGYEIAAPLAALAWLRRRRPRSARA
jgi:hypothetical protein